MATSYRPVDLGRRRRSAGPPVEAPSSTAAAGGSQAERPPERERCNLTNGQLAIWVAQSFAPDLACYANAMTFVLAGEVDTDRFTAAFQAVVDRSDALRTVIDEVDGVPVQRVLPQLDYVMPVIDLTGTDPVDPDGRADAALRRWTRERIATPPRLHERTFDAALLRLAPDRTAWYLDTHHLLHDGTSFQLVYERTAEYYERAGAGTLELAPDLPRYADYVAVEHASRQSEQWRAADAYWREVLERADEPVELYGVPSAERSHEEQWATIDLGPDRTAELLALTRASGFRSLNPDMSLLGIFATLVLCYLHRVTGARTLSIGLPVRNRGRENRDVIGLVQQVYPLVVEVGDDDTFATLMKQAMRGLLSMFAHAPQGSGNFTHRASNDVMLNYLPMSFPDFAGLSTKAEFVPKAAADGSHCLMVQVHDLSDTGSLSVDLVMNAGVFDERRRQAAPTHFLHVVDRLLADPTAVVGAVDLLGADERSAIVEGLNDTATEWPAGETIDRVVAATVARTPEATAAEWGVESLTYAELDRRANRLAHHLQSLGAAPGVVVGVYAERCLDLVVAVLAIFKAGAGYLPLDTTYPEERLAFILEDSRASILLTQQGMPTLRPGSVGTVVNLDDLAEVHASQPSTPPVNRAGAEDIAYLIYTSGSTGHPKGAAVPQRALVNVARWQATSASTVQRPRTLQFSPFSFDVSLQELFGTWCAGGTLVLPTSDVRRDPEALARLLVDARIEQLYAIFTPLQQLAEAVDRLGVVPTWLREVFTCGEQVTITPALQRFFERIPGCRFQNQYGSSEDLIVTAHTMSGPPADWPRVPPIGRPIPNTQVYVLDAHQHPVPMGVPGEICVGGAQVSLGYLHRPELTAERFVPDELGGRAGALLFRTGDLGRHLPNGELQFLGRVDSQVKLRGFRIEPGEIEAALGALPLVDEAAVVLREDEPGVRRLVAYLVPAPGWTPQSLPEVHRALSGRLAPYMVPAAFVTLDRLPKTPSGKLDRRALPHPERDRPELQTSYVEPADALERSLAAIWQDALRIERVGRHDDFFGLGGDSLLALRVVQTTEDVLDQRLPLVAIFGAPTIARLAEQLRDPGREVTHRSLLPIRVTGSKVPLFFVSAQSGHDLAAHLDPDRPFYGLHPRGLTGTEPDSSVEEMAANYLAEVATVQPHGPYLVGGACLGGQVAFEMARQLAARGEEVAATIIVESYAPGIVGFKPRDLRGRVGWRLTRVLSALERSEAGARLVSALSTLQYGKRVKARPRREQQLLTTLQRVRRSNVRALLSYAPPAYPGAVTVFHGERDGADDPSLGWDRYVTGTLELEDIPGYHGAVLREPYVSTLATKLDSCLDRTGL